MGVISMSLFQYCLSCHKFFESSVGKWIPYCPDCFPIFRNMILHHIKSARFIDIRYFDLYDSEHKHLCRVCGNPTKRKKNGSYCAKSRYCEKHSLTNLLTKYSWSFSRDAFIGSKYTNGKLFCEECGCQIKFGYEVHHITPVHLLTLENIMLIFDLTNFKLLCLNCHKKVDHHLPKMNKGKLSTKNIYRSLEFYMDQ